jgi:hypothetical protein
MVGAEDAEAVLAAIPEAMPIGEITPWSGRSVELRGIA